MPLSINKRKNELLEILDKFNEDEICEFLTISESDIKKKDVSMKIATMQNMLINIPNNTLDLLIKKLSPQKLIEVISNNNLYSPYNIIYIANSLQSEVRDNLLKQKIKYDLTRHDNCKEDNKTSILDKIDGIEYISEVRSKQEFDLIYNLYLKYFRSPSDKEICDELGNQSKRFFETIFSIDKFTNKSIDIFFMRDDWFKVKYNINKTRNNFISLYNENNISENQLDGISFFLKKLNCFSKENSITYAYSQFIKELNNKEFLSYLRNRNKNIIYEILTTKSALPTSRIFKEIINLNEMPEIKQPLLIANPDLIFDKYFNLNFKTITSYYGVEKLIGNKKEQEKIAEYLLNTNDSSKLIIGLSKLGSIRQISEKLKKLIEKDVVLNERNSDLLFVLSLISKNNEIDRKDVSAFEVQDYYKEIIKHKDKKLVKLFLRSVPVENKQDLFNTAKDISQAVFEKELLSNSLPGKNKKIVNRL
ncbi:TPA: hypothetical protein NV714_001644 [Escherichia coli]|nr:hypothetical protein [Escherichia coli]